MNSIIKRIDKGQFWKFHGGIHPPEQKFITSDKPIRSLPIPKTLILPLQQHIGEAGKLLVEIGDDVLKGQALSSSDHPMAVPIHAPTSGKITDIKNSIIAHPSGLDELCVFLTPDGHDKWQQRNICLDYTKLNKTQLIEKIANSGISGMGGAGFPTHIKVNNTLPIEYLIINAAECEPYITADDLLIREHSPSIIDGINILHQIIAPKYVLIGIEDNKPAAIKALQNATQDIEHIKVCIIPTKYPSGGEKQLIQILTGKEIPSGSLPSSQGIVMQNIATCFAIADAVINDTPLIKRVTTITGLGLEKPQNVWALLGTPVNFVLEQCEYHTQDTKQVIMGGPMMGFSLPSGNVPIVKITNCILAPSEKEISTNNQEVECIRCGQCAEVCPAQLLPQELQWSAKAKDFDQLDVLNLFDCIECGACAYVCPSHIPLVHYYRIGKAEIREQKQQEIKAEKAKLRFEARKARLERDKKAREEKQRLASEARKARMNAGTPAANNEMSAVAAALARVKAKKAQTNETLDITTSGNDPVAMAVERAKARKLALQNKKQQQDSTVTLTTQDKTENPKDTTNKADDKNAKIIATIAKAKAKKLAAKNNDAPLEPLDKSEMKSTFDKPNESATEIIDDKKAKIALTIAKAKAKKQALTTKNKPDESTFTLNVETNSTAPVSQKDTDKKAKVAAIAKTKTKELAAKKKPQLPSVELELKMGSEVSLSIGDKADDKKTRIAAAVAKARAKKKNQLPTDKTPMSAEQDKKNRIAEAVAKAKAKKLQRSELK